jgi:magnesium-transporting ATPase (P-type)
LSEIDLDSSEIVKTPIQYMLMHGNINTEYYGGETKLQNQLNAFINLPINYIDNSDNFIEKDDKLIKWKKISPHFCSYNIKQKNIYVFVFIIIFILYNAFYAFSSIFIIKFAITKMNVFYYAIFAIIFIILQIIFIKFTKKFYDNIIRIDCIYTKNYDRLFIGTVKLRAKAYKDKFIFKMDQIEKFIVEERGYNEKCFLFKALVSNNYINICQIKGSTQRELEGFVNYLNEKLKIKN